MEMSTALQVALFLASIAIVVLVCGLVPLALSLRRHTEQLLQVITELKTDTRAIATDSRELIRSLNELSRRANVQMDEISVIVKTARRWTQRADRIVDEVGEVVEPTVFSVARTITRLRAGATRFLQVLVHHNKHNHEEAVHE